MLLPARPPRFVARVIAVSWRDLAVSTGPILLISAAAIWLAIHLIQPAPPDTLTISAGPQGSSFWNDAQRYKAILARNGITLKVLPSAGSLQNLERLSDPNTDVDVGFVQSGVTLVAQGAAGASAPSAPAASGAAGTAGSSASAGQPNSPQRASEASPASGSNAASPSSVSSSASGSSTANGSSTASSATATASNEPAENLVSLGSVSYVPLVIFYEGGERSRLRAFAGERIAIGPEGSGTRALALALLKANGIVPGDGTTLLPLTGEAAARALTAHEIDAAFLTGDSAQPPVMARLLRTPGVRLFSFSQAQAYARRFSYLTDVKMPMGVFDLGKNLPPATVHTVAPTAELVARDSLHPALSDLLIEAAKEVHGRASLLQNAGEFPSPVIHDFPISDDAARYYKSGKSFLYRLLPFWLASLVDRLIVLIVPIVVVLIPGVRLIPSLYAWRVKSRIYRWYGALIAIERSALDETATEEERATSMTKLVEIEAAVNRLKMPLAYADQFYVLRQHIGFVRARLAQAYDERTHTEAGGA
ncbi:C4-dicarboxylate ABC transporter substrate-binding protein [Trinickia dinghuensis]|uniref:C4-dicarboxylate ABC transporter substrate-binding protein n=2 Tax=Trinickia dinghuensis TaxID=2291023 RepID=A0A3D8JUR0_9BURK|nr:TAXI family TRAP transporter solute-binding subunit [Trinickia dinghuensis]RDU96131.1 C4-dicarboxylate ABC transporter substrate-binding protein [Trinickia dinghuensis]